MRSLAIRKKSSVRAHLSAWVDHNSFEVQPVAGAVKEAPQSPKPILEPRPGTLSRYWGFAPKRWNSQPGERSPQPEQTVGTVDSS